MRSSGLSVGALPPALVMGQYITALGVVRSLGRKGIPQFGIGAGRSFVTYSRWYRPLPSPTPDSLDPSSLAAFLEPLPFDRLVLIPCSDAWAAAVAALEPRLATRFPASQAPQETLDLFLDKGCFAETLLRLGLPHPRTTRLGPRDDLAIMWDRAPEGAFLKPCNSHAFGLHFGIKGLRFKTRAEATACVIEARQAGLELVLQEYIPGPATAHYFVDGFVDRTGKICARFARRRLRMFPAEFGCSSSVVSVPLKEVTAAVASLDRLLLALNYRGIFSAEFKHDPRDGLFKFLEVNVRPWWQVAFAVECGVDVCEMTYRDALELPVEPVTDYRVGRYWVYPNVDLRACWELLRKGTLTPWTWLRSWAGASDPTFTWDDPVPGAVNFIEDMRRFLRRRLFPRKRRRRLSTTRETV